MNGALVGGWVTYSTAARLYQRSQVTPGAAKRERKKEIVCVCVCVCVHAYVFVYWTDKWVVEHMLSSVLQQRKKSLLYVMGLPGSRFSQSESVVPCQPGYKEKLATKLNVSCRFPTSAPPLSTRVTHQGINKWKLMKLNTDYLSLGGC
jgi:hypothetical protein